MAFFGITFLIPMLFDPDNIGLFGQKCLCSTSHQLDQLVERLRNGLQEELEKSLLALQSGAAGALSEGAGLLLGMGADGALMFIAVVNQANPASQIDIDYCRQRYSWEVETLRENVALLVMNGKEPDEEAFLYARLLTDAAGMYQGSSLSVHGASQSGSGALLLALTKKDPVKVVVVVTGAGEMALGSLIAGASSWRLVDNLQEMSSGAQGDSKPSNKPYKNNKEANKQAQKQGYKDAHELKQDYVGKNDISKYDMKYDTKTGEIYLESKDGKIQIPTDLIHEP